MLKRRINRVTRPPSGCALTECVRYLRGAWTANVLWYLGAHSRRFTELKQDLRGISSKVLVDRLHRLQRDGLILKTRMRTSPPSIEYSLTTLGRELQPALDILVKVGEKMKSNPTGAPHAQS